MPTEARTPTLAPGETVAGAFAGDALYEQLRAFVLSSLPHQALASERRLAALHDISQTTVRGVLDRLVAEGLIYKRRGRGSFVAERVAGNTSRAQEIVYVDTWQNLGHAYYARRLQGMIQEADARGLRFQVLKCGHTGPIGNERLFAEIRRREVVGLITPWLGPELHAAIREADSGIKIVTTASPTDDPGAACVRGDFVAMGRQVMAWLAGQGTGRVALAWFNAETLAGALARKGSMEFHQIPEADALETPVLCERILAMNLDGLFFDQDRTAAPVLQMLCARQPDFCRRVRVVSHANVGEDLLPPGVTRYEIDGLAVGRLLVRVLQDMVQSQLFADTEIQVRGRLVPASA